MAHKILKIVRWLDVPAHYMRYSPNDYLFSCSEEMWEFMIKFFKCFRSWLHSHMQCHSRLSLSLFIFLFLAFSCVSCFPQTHSNTEQHLFLNFHKVNVALALAFPSIILLWSSSNVFIVDKVLRFQFPVNFNAVHAHQTNLMYTNMKQCSKIACSRLLLTMPNDYGGY